jgi:hypothetical protein
MAGSVIAGLRIGVMAHGGQRAKLQTAVIDRRYSAATVQDSCREIAFSRG